MHSVSPLRDALTPLSQAELTLEMLNQMTVSELVKLDRDFAVFAHRHQDTPRAANNGAPWSSWLVLAGRGAGKTRLGAEWVRAQALGRTPYANARAGRIALIGETLHDVRAVMIEGPAGILRISPRGSRPDWHPSLRRLVWTNGAVAEMFSADDPESLRGPQFDAAWCDELAKWREADAAFDMLQFGLRLGARPRQIITTTPRPSALIKRLTTDPRTAVTRASTHANARYLAPDFIAAVEARYGGTRLGRQEIGGEIVEDRADALWTRAQIEDARVAAAPPLMRIVVGIDPPASLGEDAACGIVAAGIGEDDCVYVLEDATVEGIAPAGWAARAIALYRRLDADTMVAEVNQGGEMVRAVLRNVDASAPLKTVHATRGKYLRAEPVAALYAQGRVRHAGAFPDLEDQMCAFGLDGLPSGRSPDRLDALVWAVTELTQRRGEPRIRVI